MNYPKELMSITELTKLGYSRDMLNAMTKAEGSPVVVSKNGGKYFFDTSKFEEWHKEYTRRLKNRR